ncbi:MAG: hypothetical protein HQK62_04165 [Desulfamplus sp.]|nr:hypothetical protein [Desulfamplus sp.]
MRKFEQLPLFSSLVWLILTHHKLPEGNYNRKKFDFDKEAAFFGKNSTKDDKQQAITFSNSKIMPWQNRGWCDSLASNASRLIHFLEEQTPYLVHSSDDLKIAMAHIARPFLVLGDYQASATKQFYTDSDKSNLCFANTIDNRFADTLNQHLHKAKKETSRCFRLLMNYQNNPDFRTITASQIPPILSQKPNMSNSQSAFHWQEHSCHLVREQHKNSIQESGFFGILAAKTGAGKTVAAARIMAMLSKELRFSLALGLRSLTLQAGKDYEDKERIGFEKNQIAVMVGSKVSQALFEQQQKLEDQEEDGERGSFDEGLAEDYDVVHDGDTGELKSCFFVLTDKQLKILATPVLISTVDHIIAPVDSRKSSSTLMSLRLMTSDLILDEVDSYSYSDLVALGKLVYLTGLYGHKVLLVSATLPPAIAVNFYRAYQQGFSQYLRLNSMAQPIFCGWFSDQYKFSCLRRCDSVVQYQKQHYDFSKNVVSHLTSQYARRPAQLLDINGCTSENHLFDKVLEHCFDMHHRHHVMDKATSARVSIGLVRWNNTGPCVAFTIYLLNRDRQSSDLPYKVICYHSKLLPIVLHEVENFCRKALKRSEDKLLQQKEIQSILQREKPKDLLILVAATSIIEVGRDFDFDWGIFEPQSTRSVIQTAGRILRHREKVVNSPNVALLSTTYRGLFKPEPAYSYPGIETDGQRYICRLTSKFVMDLFDFESMQCGINAQWTLLEPDKFKAEISFHEHQAYKIYLEDDEKGRDLKHWVELPELHLHGYHSRENRFRDGLYSEGLYLFRQMDIDEDEITLKNWRALDNKGSRNRREHSFDYDTSIKQIDVCHENRLLLRIDIEKSLLALKNEGFEESLLKKLVAIELDFWKSSPTLQYHDALGLSIVK